MGIVTIADSNEVPYSATNKLQVEAQLVVADIQIGAVELQDSDTGLRQNVKSDGINNAAIVLINSRKDIEGLGDIVVGTTQVQIVFSGTPTTIRIKADAGNTGIIFLGKNGVLANGTNDFIRLVADDELTIDYDDTSNPLFVISDLAGQKISGGALL